MPRGCQHPQPHGAADLKAVAVADRSAVEADGVGSIDQVTRASRTGERQSAGDIVVVDMGLGDVSDPHAPLLGQGRDAVNIPLRVDDDRHLAVVRQVAAVAKSRRLD